MIATRPTTPKRMPVPDRWPTKLTMIVLSIAAAGLIAWSNQSTRAEFEVPLLDASTAVPTTFRGVWSFQGGNVVVNGYRAYGVGVDTSVTGPNASDTSGVFYEFAGTSWKRLIDFNPTDANPTTPAPALYAVTGQRDHGTGSTNVIIGGAKAKLYAVYLQNDLVPANATSYFKPVPLVGASPNDRDVYALVSGQSYATPALAGGQNGLLIRFAGALLDGSLNPRPWTVVNTANPAESDRALGANETITGMTMSQFGNAYITTTVFDNSTGQIDFDCADDLGTPAHPTSHLYKVDVSSTPLKWTDLSGARTGCYYGLTVALNDQVPSNHGPYQNSVWVGTNNGLWKYDERLGSYGQVAGTSGFVYGLASAEERSGNTQNLLLNGSFEALNKSTAGPVDSTYFPDVWLGNSCTGPDFSVVYRGTSPGEVKDGDYAFKITPSANCKNPGPYNGVVPLVINRVPVSTIENTKYRISGWYRVEFPLPDYVSYQKAQGGVSFNCTGGTAPKTTQSPVWTVPCSYSEREFVRSWADGNLGWTYFSIDMSRENFLYSQFGMNYGSEGETISPIPYQSTQRVGLSGMQLEIRCEASYGATVWCDGLKVEEISDPPVPNVDTITVIGVGQNGAIITNDDALNASSSFRNEATSTNFSANTFYGISAAGVQHVYAVGTDSLAVGRTPSTLSGYIWVGAGSPTDPNSPTTQQGAGWISVSCLNDRKTTSLCQRSPESYGLSLDLDNASSRVSGQLSGRAWFGKTAVSQTKEFVDLGACLGNAHLGTYRPAAADPGIWSPYRLTGMCDQASWRCRVRDNATGHPTTTLSAKTCRSDFDCFGRCANDRGFICVNDDDCRVSANSLTSDFAYIGEYDPDYRVTTNGLLIAPVDRLQCGPWSSSLACKAGGWLSVNPTDFSAAERIAPDGSTIGVTYNTASANCSAPTGHNCGYPAPGNHELSGWARLMTPAGDANNAGKGYCSTSAVDPTDRGKSCTSDANCTDVPGSKCIIGGGWIHFRGAAASPAGTSLTVKEKDNVVRTNDYFFGCKDCLGSRETMSCSFCTDSQSHSCQPPFQASTSYGTCTYFCNGDPSLGTCTNKTECAAGQDCLAPSYCSRSGAVCDPTAANACAGQGICVTGAVCKVAAPGGYAPAQCAAYGVNYSIAENQFAGYAWSPDLGWLDMHGVGQARVRYVQTRLGDIYAQQDIGGSVVPLPTPLTPDTCNATFLIRSSGNIENFCSALGTTVAGGKIPVIGKYASLIPFGSAGNTYQNVLGRLDVDGIETDIGGNKNKYGSPIKRFTAPTGDLYAAFMKGDLDANNGSLGGKIFVAKPASGAGSYTLGHSSLIQFANSTNLSTQGPGNGALIVNGDLTIEQGMEYQTSGVIDDLRKLQSLVVIVKGNLTIDNSVEDLVGAYYVLGTVTTAANPLGAQNPLEVHGLIIAKEFVLNRQFAGTVETPQPSELVIFDGRIQSNPLPGMIDFANALPNTTKSGP